MSPRRSGRQRPLLPSSHARRGVTPGDLAAPLVVAIAAFVLYIPALSYKFLNWDDADYVLNNPWIREWSWRNLAHIFTTPYFTNFLPLHLVSYMVDHSLWGLNPVGYHLQSVLLHALNAVLALLVVRRMLGGTAVPLLAALFFAVHPSHVEAVAWISIRKELLSTSFALLTVYLYMRSIAGASLRWAPYAASVVCFTLGLLSKVSIATLPLFLLLLDATRPAGERRAWIPRIAGLIPHVLVAIWLVRLNSMIQTEAKAPYAHDALSYAIVKGHAAWNYLGLLAGILRGSPDYDLPVLGKGIWTILVSIAGLALLPACAWVAHRLRSRALLLGTAWIFIMLLPALAFPLVTYMADRYLYAPSLGFCWLLAAGIVGLGTHVAAPRWKAAIVAGIVLIPIAWFAARTVQALPVWRDSESLWSYAVTRCGDFRAYTNLAGVRLEQGRWDEAERLLRISARVEDATTYQNFGVLYFQQGRYPEAVGAIEHALAILRRERGTPAQTSVLYYNLGAVYWKLGQSGKAIEALEAALRENPLNVQARERLEALRAGQTGP